MRSPTRLLLFALALAAPAASGEEIYRSVMPNGDVLYGESPAPGAKSVRKVQPPPSGVVIVTPEDRQRATTIQSQQGGVSVVPKKECCYAPPAVAGSGATYGTGPGPLPKREY